MSDVQSESTNPVQDQVITTSANRTRKKLLGWVALLVILAGLIYLVWSLFFNNSVSTDNAYVGADNAHITSMINGQVLHVWPDDTVMVKKGDPLVEIDRRDALIALQQAEAEFAKTRRQYQQSFATSQALNSQVTVQDDEINSAQAALARAQADFAKASQDLQRREQLNRSGAISAEEISSAQSAVQTAIANVNVAKASVAQAKSNQKAAQSKLAANEALIKNSDENNAPDVLIAKAKLDQAKLDLERSLIRAPIDGVVSQRNVQVGQRVAPGTVMMSIVPISKLYVDANFKENQLTRVRVGQSVTLYSDLYGHDVKYKGKVVGFSGGTGAAFALIPAQNATGNWIKVVQRLPVRIALDPQQLAAHPLRVGLSMEATIDLNSKS